MTPLLSFEGFPPEAQAIKATLPQVAEFRAVHNIESLEQNAADLGPERARASRGEAPSLAGALYGENPLLPSVANTFVGVQGSINGNGADQAMISP